MTERLTDAARTTRFYDMGALGLPMPREQADAADLAAYDAGAATPIAGGRNKLRVITDAPPTPTEWIVGGLIPQGTCVVLGAEEKTGKTWITFAIAIAVANGLSVMGRWKVQVRGNVLLYSPESGWNAKKQRLWGLAWGMGLDPREALRDIIFVDGRLNLALHDDIAALQEIAFRLGAVLVVADPLIACYLDRDENSSTEVQPVLNAIRGLVERCPTMSVLLAHHLSKANKERSPFHGLRGSSALGGWADGLIQLRKETQDWDSPRRMDVVHRDAPSPAPAGFRILEVPRDDEPNGLPAYRLEPCDAPDVSGRVRPDGQVATGRREQLLNIITREPQTMEQLYDAGKAIGASERTVRRDVQSLRDAGVVMVGLDKRIHRSGQ